MTTERLTREQAAIITAFTGILMGPIEDLYVIAERLLHRPFMTHDFADKKLWAELKVAVQPEFMAIVAEK